MTKKRTDGWYHARNAKITFFICAIIGAILAYSNLWWGFGLLLGSFIGIFVSPDLDNDWRTHNEWLVDRVFGKFIGRLFSLYWAAYETFIPHRSPLSHGGFLPAGPFIMVLIATPIRMLYMFWWVFLLWRWEYGKIILSMIPLTFVLFLYAGLAVQDLVHWGRDYL